MFRTIILIHGAWHNSSCWYKIVNNLSELGHQVFAPDLPGHVDDIDHESITLDIYVNFIEDIIKKAIYPVILIGHSMAGIIITQIAGNIPDKIYKLIYLSAFIPEDNCSLIDEENKSQNPTVSKEAIIDQQKYSIFLPNHPDIITKLFYNCCSDDDIKYGLYNICTQPLLPFTNIISLSNLNRNNISKIYIECVKDNAILIEDQRRMYSKIDCSVYSIDTDHSPFFSSRDELLDIIYKVIT